MKIGTIERNGIAQVVVCTDDDKAVILADCMDSAPADIMQVLNAEETLLSKINTAIAGKQGVDIESLKWLPPIPKPGKIVCIALNNSANKDRIMKGPSHPATFIKPSSSLVGHGQPIRLKDGFGRVHPEPELTVIIGKGGTDIAKESALDHVFGYSIINDLTAPLMRGDDTFHYRAIHPKADGTPGIEYKDSWVSYPGRYKGCDTFGPMGPWIATADSIPDPHNLTISCLHKGELITEDNTANLNYKVADAIAFISSYMSLEPGDIIAMGTALKAANTDGKAVQNIDLTQTGGPIEVRISGIGSLVNPVEKR